MRDMVSRYIGYGANGELQLSVPTTLLGGYDRAATCKMVRELSDYYKQHIMQLMDVIAQQDRALSEQQRI